MSYINESCGCEGGNNYNSQVNNSPILSGSQESAFSPQNGNFSFLDNGDDILGASKNNFSTDDNNKQNFSLDDLITMSNENNKPVNENKFSNNNIQQMNNQNQHNFNLGNTNTNAYNNDININQALNNIPNLNSRTGNAIPDTGMMRNNMPTNVNPELQAVMNKIAAANQLNALNKATEVKSVTESNSSESSWRFIVKNFNIVLVIVIALAWSDVAKFYINRSIKFGGGNHKYYIYYAVIASVVLYGTSKYVHYLE